MPPPVRGDRPPSPAGLVAASAAVGLVFALSSCAVSTPSASEWRTAAAQSLADSSSAVSTVRLVLEEQKAGRVWQSYVVVVLTEQEKTAAEALDSLLRQQRPTPVRREEAEAVTALLEASAAGTREARETVVDGRQVAAAALEELTTLARDLGERSRRMEIAAR